MYMQHGLCAQDTGRRALPDQGKVFPLAMPATGPACIDLDPAALWGMWQLRFGLFGCLDSETRGGIAVVDEGRLMGGDSQFAYHGRWTLEGSELRATLSIFRHGNDPSMPTLLGTNDRTYQLECIAEIISIDVIEGRLRRPGFPDVRVAMRRVQDTPDRSGRLHTGGPIVRP
ncbi:MAG: hypothetical protein V4618_10690 [Pseudomonadota bacterium]